MWRREFCSIFCFYFPFLIIFCARALERTQAAETEASTDSRWNLLRIASLIVCIVYTITSGVQKGGVWSVQTPPRNSEVLTKLSRIPSSVENTSITT